MMMNDSKTVLVTGGLGFIASHFVHYLHKKFPNFRIIVVDKLDSCSSMRNLEPLKLVPLAVGSTEQAESIKSASDELDAIYFVKADIACLEMVQSIFNMFAPINLVFHFAAQTSVDRSFLGPKSLQFTRDNVLGTHCLLETCSQMIKTLGSGRFDLFLYCSTDEVYGGQDPSEQLVSCFTESSAFNPTNPYAASKASGECLVQAYAKSFSLPILITRSNNVYGPKQYPEKMIARSICRILLGKSVFIHGNGLNKRRYLYIEDLISALDLIWQKGTRGSIYNIGSDDEMSNIDLAKMLFELSTGESNASNLEYVSDRFFNDFCYNISDDKLRRTLNWSPKYSLEQGLKETIEWYRCNACSKSEKFVWWSEHDDFKECINHAHPYKDASKKSISHC